MKQMAKFLPVMLVTVSFVSASFAAHTHAPTPSTWKLDLAKTDFGGGPTMKSDVYRDQTDTDKWLRYTETMVDGDGKVWHTSWSGPEDGTTRPIVGMPGATYRVKTDNDSAVMTMPDGTVMDQWISMSDDKKQTTFKCLVKTKDGKEYHQTLVYKRIK